ncbi:SACE_7040 family transcriptional regulator [Occultella kanbiaonis]|uniref:SACE_7040 family transcriptional regulator n=1 Tax=Occultella kanbiaonis TaxID=2675754 RepID=UPI0012B6DA49|nr:TetR/AcrR family transcriptional regulator [Occultella kanbiaonis]
MSESAGSAAGSGAVVAGSRREEILAAAADLFARHGFRGVSIYDIGAAVGISGPALYRHFRSKGALLSEMLVSISATLLSEGRRRSEAAEDPTAALAALVDWHIEFALDHLPLITIQYRDLDSLAEAERDEVRRLQREYVEIWVRLIRELYPEVEERTARSGAHAVFGLINSTPHSARLARADMEALLRTMALAALAGVATTVQG